jgi:hypothetical protein
MRKGEVVMCLSWIPSSVKCLSALSNRVCHSVSFEFGRTMLQTERGAFYESTLIALYIPASENSSCKCASLTSVTFSVDYHCLRLEAFAFYASRLTAIQIPASVEVIGKRCFSYRRQRSSVTFVLDCELSRLEQ